MNLKDKIKLMDSMIKENPDTTISEYLQLLFDIEKISMQAKLKELNNAKTADLRPKYEHQNQI